MKSLSEHGMDVDDFDSSDSDAEDYIPFNRQLFTEARYHEMNVDDFDSSDSDAEDYIPFKRQLFTEARYHEILERHSDYLPQ
jgi:hypothetical protein